MLAETMRHLRDIEIQYLLTPLKTSAINPSTTTANSLPYSSKQCVNASGRLFDIDDSRVLRDSDISLKDSDNPLSVSDIPLSCIFISSNLSPTLCSIWRIRYLQKKQRPPDSATLRTQGYTRSRKVSERKAEGSVSSMMICGEVCLPFESLAEMVAIV